MNWAGYQWGKENFKAIPKEISLYLKVSVLYSQAVRTRRDHQF